MGCYVNLKGRVQAIFRVIKLSNNELLLKLPTELIETTITELQKYAMFSKVTVEPIIDGSLVCIGLYYQTNNREVIASAVEQSIIINESNNWILQEIIIKAENLNPIWQELTKNLTEITEQEAENIYIALKIPEVYQSTYEEFLPHNIGLVDLDAVSFTKGCYRGQEIIARMQHRGTIKYKTYVLNLDSKDKAIGKIIRAATNKASSSWVLAELPISHDDACAEITLHPE